MRFLAHPAEAAGLGDGPCAWIVDLGAVPEVLVAAPTREDLADAALARTADGGAGRLWRRRLLRTLAAAWLGVPAREVVFHRDAAGAVRMRAPQPARCSAAGRGAWSMVAVGTGPVGADVEVAGPDLAALAAQWGLMESDALRRWTAAEAYAKAAGCPLEAALAAVRGDVDEPLQAPGWPALRLAVQPLRDGMAAAAF